MRNKLRFIFILLCFVNQTKAQEIQSVYKNLYIGLEQDILPYFCKGYSVGIWLGFDQFKAKINLSQFVRPHFISNSSLKEEKIILYQFSLNFFLNKKLRGIYLSTHLSQSFLSLQSKDQYKKISSDDYFGIGLGYKIYFFKNFYLSTQLALHFKLNQTKDIFLGNFVYKSALVLPEINLNIGYKF